MAAVPEDAVRILVVEDEEKLARALQRGLEEEGYAVDVAGDGVSGEQLALAHGYDLVILDWMLPGLDGLVLCRRLRAAGDQAPYLLLTARGATVDKIKGLDAGADDYLAKPFDFEELLARVRALLRRRGDRAPVLRVGDLELDPATRRVRRGAAEVVLTAKEFALLEYLMRHAGQVLSRATIEARVWGDADVASNIVDVYIRYLRDKMDRGPGPTLIQTVRGAGYTLRES